MQLVPVLIPFLNQNQIGLAQQQNNQTSSSLTKQQQPTGISFQIDNTTFALSRNDQIQSDKKDEQKTPDNYLEESPDATDVTATQKKKGEIKNTNSNSANITGTIVTTT